jgi:uncharacterized protein (DUF1684 family)
MRHLWLWAIVLDAATGCSRGGWPSPPPIDPGAYEKQHDAWLEGERAYLSEVLPLIGIWPLDEGASAFGSDDLLPIVLPATKVPALAGTFHRAGNSVTVVSSDFDLFTPDGSRLDGERHVKTVLAGPLRLDVTDAGDDRRWVAATDTTHPAILAPPPIPSYPVDWQWRVLARFDGFKPPRKMRVPDVRGGTMEFTAVGQLVFPLGGAERRLTAVGTEGGRHLAVWFKDRTNGSTTYGGYRVVRPQAVGDGQMTVLDFNFAYNPPCAYSSFTTCPLAPPENRLPVAVEAGLKELPSVTGH